MTFKEIVERHLRRKAVTIEALEKTLGYDNHLSAHVVLQGAMAGKRLIPKAKLLHFARALGVKEETLRPFATQPKGRGKRRARTEKAGSETLFTGRDLRHLVKVVDAVGPLPMNLLVEHVLLNRARKNGRK